MSLLTRGTDEVQVFPELEQTDARRNLVRGPGSKATPVSGRMQPVSSEESAAQGQQVSTLYRFICRDFPGGPWALVQWGGRDFDVVGEPGRHNSSRATRRVNVLLRARGPLPVATSGG